MGFWWNLLSGCQVWDQGIQYHLSSTHRRLWGLVVVWLSKLSGRALAAHARVILGSTPADCRTLYFCLITFKSLFPAWSKILWANIYYTYNNHDQLCPNQSEGIFSDSIIVLFTKQAGKVMLWPILLLFTIPAFINVHMYSCNELAHCRWHESGGVKKVCLHMHISKIAPHFQ